MGPQALLQVLQPQFDPTFSEPSYGFGTISKVWCASLI
jgi:hypothetical protein